VAVDPELLELMPSQLTLQPPADQDVFGQKTYGEPVNVEHAHIEYQEVYVKSDPGKAVFAQGTIYLDDVYPVDTEWLVTVPPGGPYGQVVKIVKVEQYEDENGPYSTVLYIGRR
jgi:hypothetical protein